MRALRRIRRRKNKFDVPPRWNFREAILLPAVSEDHAPLCMDRIFAAVSTCRSDRFRGLLAFPTIEYVRRLLGHANVSTTRRYGHLDDRELAEARDLVE